MPQNTMFGNKRFIDSEDITQTNIHWHFEPRRDLDLEQSNQIFSQDTPTYGDVPSN